MGEVTAIPWTDHTFNLVWGCTKISPGCTNCYAERNAKRYGCNVWGQAERRTLSEGYWRKPLKWNRKAAQNGHRPRVFCGSMCDLFEDHPTVEHERQKLWSLIRQTPALDWLLLTKRADRIKACLPDDWGTRYANVWLGVTIENADYKWRADYLRAIPALIRFVSYEPAIGPLELDLAGIDWLIYGGESGPKHRPDSPEWARSIKAQCEAGGTAFFFKQSSGLHPGSGSELDGQIIRNLPTARNPYRGIAVETE
jgi:protein gp37